MNEYLIQIKKQNCYYERMIFDLSNLRMVIMYEKEKCEKQYSKNLENLTRIIGYSSNLNYNFISCYYIKDRQAISCRKCICYDNAVNWLDDKDILLLL
jgi:hypothetical protein